MRENSKIQIPNPKEIPKSKFQSRSAFPGPCSAWRSTAWNLKFGIWILFGNWILGFGISLHAAPAPPSRNIGIEGSVSLPLPRADYRVRPLDDRTELILRIEKIAVLTNGQHRYDFFYMGLEPGLYKLADYLIRPDGSRPDELGAMQIQVRALLPEEHNGQLNAYTPRRFPFIGGYRGLLLALAVAWAGGLITFIVVSRRKRPVEIPLAVAPEPSLAERLRPLVEAAAAGELSVEDQARLERLLMGYWRDKLNLPELRMADALARLKAHGEAGELLRTLERWLHRPGGATREEVSGLLAPYRFVPAREGGAG